MTRSVARRTLKPVEQQYDVELKAVLLPSEAFGHEIAVAQEIAERTEAHFLRMAAATTGR